MCNFQIYSDLHLEFKYDYPKIKKYSDNLILAGDIGKINDINYNSFIEYVSNLWEKVFIVLGNHEYYLLSSHFEKTKKKYKKYLSKFDNIYLLDCNEHIIDNDTIILGATFWTKIDKSIKLKINDFNIIKYYDIEKRKRCYITDVFINKEHLKEKEWLKKMLIKKDVIKYKNIIIISHFPLTRFNTSHIKYDNQTDDLKNYFSNDFDDILQDKFENKIYQIAGHTHHNYNFVKNGINYLSNQFGYTEDSDCINSFNDKYILDI